MELLEERIVTFLDILGFKEAINSADEQKYRRIYDVLKNFAFLNGEHRVDYRLEDNEIISGFPAVSSFSDHVVISMGTNLLNAPQNVFAGDPYHDFIVVLNRAARLSDIALLNGFLVRGGITHGEIAHINNIVYGKALLDAYEIESSVATYPRIVLSKNLINLLGARALDELIGKKLIIRDFDGLYYINWINAPQLKGTTDYTDKLVIYKESVLGKLAEYAGDIKKMKYWQWMLRYLQLQQ